MTDLLRFDEVALVRGGRLLFEGLSFSVAPGEALQVRGANGAGKSSLIHLAAGLLHQRAGSVHRTPLSLADDNAALDRELPLACALRFWGGEVGPPMDAVGIAHLADVPVRFLSSGQLKRAALARVAGSGVPMWLLDEPLNALDGDGIERLGAMIERHRAEGGSVLAASHQPLPGDWSIMELGA